MTLTQSINDIIAQAHRLLDHPDLSDWSPPDTASPEEAAALEDAEAHRRAAEAVDRYLADRSDRLELLRAIRASATRRAEEYKAQAEPWLRLGKRQQRLVEYVEQLGKNVLVTERQAAGLSEGEPYEVTLPSGIKMGIRLSTPAVKILDLEDLPGRYCKVEKTAIKTEIAKALKAGKVVPGAELARGEHIHWGR